MPWDFSRCISRMREEWKMCENQIDVTEQPAQEAVKGAIHALEVNTYFLHSSVRHLSHRRARKKPVGVAAASPFFIFFSSAFPHTRYFTNSSNSTQMAEGIHLLIHIIIFK